MKKIVVIAVVLFFIYSCQAPNAPNTGEYKTNVEVISGFPDLKVRLPDSFSNVSVKKSRATGDVTELNVSNVKEVKSEAWNELYETLNPENPLSNIAMIFWSEIKQYAGEISDNDSDLDFDIVYKLGIRNIFDQYDNYSNSFIESNIDLGSIILKKISDKQVKIFWSLDWPVNEIKYVDGNYTSVIVGYKPMRFYFVVDNYQTSQVDIVFYAKFLDNSMLHYTKYSGTSKELFKVQLNESVNDTGQKELSKHYQKVSYSNSDSLTYLDYYYSSYYTDNIKTEFASENVAFGNDNIGGILYAYDDNFYNEFYGSAGSLLYSEEGQNLNSITSRYYPLNVLLPLSEEYLSDYIVLQKETGTDVYDWDGDGINEYSYSYYDYWLENINSSLNNGVFDAAEDIDISNLQLNNFYYYDSSDLSFKQMKAYVVNTYFEELPAYFNFRKRDEVDQLKSGIISLYKNEYKNFISKDNYYLFELFPDGTYYTQLEE